MKKALCTEVQSAFLLFLVGPAGVEPTTNGLKVLNSVPLFTTLSTNFSVDKKWCASFCVVCTAGKKQTLLQGILARPNITAAINSLHIRCASI
ncbi:hypothetical protein ACHEXK_05990 [Limnohabitans sp. DCL3]|uniref:hypothetical protein n=1 Tax=Limnohabitans sp. DCL3 TaxID=3374103 RepID=UPI003A8912BA